MTLAEGVLRLVRSGPRMVSGARESSPVAEPETDEDAANASFAVLPLATGETVESEAIELPAPGPGISDIEAAVALISSGVATRVVLSGFPSWPGLLWEAYKLAAASGVVILPALVRPGGRVDIVIERDPAADV